MRNFIIVTGIAGTNYLIPVDTISYAEDCLDKDGNKAIGINFECRSTKELITVKTYLTMSELQHKIWKAQES